MEYNINNYVFNASIFKYFEIKKINKEVKKALKLIDTYDDKYDLKNKLNISFEHITDPEIVVAIKYDCKVDESDPLYFVSNNKRGYYSFNRFNKFNEKYFYNKVIKPYTNLDYDEFIAT